MRYVLIDPFAKVVIEGDDARLDERGDESPTHLKALYDLMDCYTVEFQDMGFRPLHDIILDGHGTLHKEQPPTFVIGDQHLVGKALILGRRGRNSISCSLPLEKVQGSVRFDVGPKVVREPKAMSFGTLEELRVYRATLPVPRWL